MAFLDHSALSPPEVRDVLDEIEVVNAKVHGYGSLNFGRNLRQCYEHLCERAVQPDDLRTVMAFAERILECPMETIDGVAETLEYLHARHDLTLFTKGNPEEQKLKIDRSKLGRFFQHTAIVKEKDTAAYQRLVAERQLDPDRTWMVGNSPKSDINPRDGGRPQRGLHSPRPHLGIGEAGHPAGRWPLTGVASIRGTATAFLRSAAFVRLPVTCNFRELQLADSSGVRACEPVRSPA
ncbi:MAG: HAD hydrolase-like protein [Ignavibacteriota bacterium]